MTRSSRRIDHLVLAVHDLTAAASWYERLGFQVGARNRHPWGTENHVIQFGSSFLELITVADPDLIPAHAPGQFSFGAFVRDYLSEREGLAMFVLDSADAQADAAAYARAGIGDFRPFTFERTGRTADGTETHVAFSLAFAVDDLVPDAAFFTCQQHYPGAFWSPALQRHPNGATNVSSVSLAVESPVEHVDFLRAFTGVPAKHDGRLFLLAADGALRVEASTTTGFRGFTVAVDDLENTSAQLTADQVPFLRHPDRIAISPDDGFGTLIEFAQVR